MTPPPVSSNFDWIWRKWLSVIYEALFTRNIVTIADADMSNSWVTYSASYPVKYWKDGLGIVHLEGVVKTGTINTTLATLPAGYRPQHDHIIATISNDAIGRLNISTAGVLTPAVGNNTYFSLYNIQFRAV